MSTTPQSRKFTKLMDKEQQLMLKGKGVFRAAKEQLEEEEAEEFYSKLHKKNRQQKKRYHRSSEERIGEWAGNTADMIYNRKKKRGKHGSYNGSTDNNSNA